MQLARAWLLLCFGCFFSCCPGIAAAEPSSRVAGGLSGDEGREALVHRLITSDPEDWCTFSTCPRPAPPEPPGSAADNYEAYAAKVIATDRNRERIGVSVYNWVGIKNFDQLVEASKKSPDFCIRLLSDKKYSGNQKGVALLSTYDISIDQRMVFVSNLMKLRDQDLISPAELMQGLEPRLSIDRVYEHYREKGVQSLLKEMEARDNIPPNEKERIRYIRSGEAFAHLRWRDFDRDCLSEPRTRSIAACASLATQVVWVYAVSRMTW